MEENNGVQMPQKKSFIQRNMSVIVVTVVTALLVVGGWTFIKDSTFTGSEITTADLVNESASGISFSRPMQWDKVETNDEDIDAAYTEGGENLDNSDQGMLLSSEDLGVNYADLSDDQKALISNSFREQFSNPESLQNGSCEQIGNVNTGEKSQEGYDAAFSVEATCEKFAGRNVKATIKMLVGIKGDKIHVVGVLAINETWDKSQEALDAVLDSVTPAI